MFFQELPIKKIEMISPEVYRLGFASREIARMARPGQFLMIKPKACAEPGSEPMRITQLRKMA